MYRPKGHAKQSFVSFRALFVIFFPLRQSHDAGARLQFKRTGASRVRLTKLGCFRPHQGSEFEVKGFEVLRNKTLLTMIG